MTERLNNNNMEGPQKVKNVTIPYDLAVPFLSFYLKKTKTNLNVYTHMFIEALFIVLKTLKQPLMERSVPLPMEFSRQEHWAWVPFPSPGDLLDPGIEPASLVPPAVAGGFFTTSTSGEAHPPLQLKRKHINLCKHLLCPQ